MCIDYQTQNVCTYTQQSEQIHLLESLLTLNKKIFNATIAEEAIDIALNEVQAYFNMKWCILRLIDKQTGDLVLISCSGLSEEEKEKARNIRPEGTLLGEAIQKGKAVFVEDMNKDQNNLRLPYYAKDMRSIAVAPIISVNEIIGTLKVYSPFPRRWLENDLKFMDSVASIFGLAWADINVRNLLHQQTLMVISALSSALEARDAYTKGHSERVSRLAVTCAKILGLDKSQEQNLRHGSLAHDIGKVGVHDSTLLKPGHLSEGEWEEVKQHSMVGYNIVKEGGLPSELLLAVRHHHEDWNGGGYPDGLKGEEIPLLARVIRIADVYDALTSERPYRKSMLAAEAIEILRQEAGRQFDPCIVDAFLQICPLDAAESKLT